MEYNNPKIFIFIGIIGSLVAGSCQPALGLVLSRYLGYMAVPIKFLPIYYPGQGKNSEEILSNVISIFGLILFGMAIIAFLSKAAQVYLFGYLSNKVTHKIR